MRWTRLAIAVVIAACAKGERNQPAQSASSTNPADSAMSAATSPADSSAGARTADTLAPKKAATQTKAAKSGTSATVPATAATKTGAPPTTGPTGAEAMMGRTPNAPPQQLTKEQVKKLQTALKKQGCYSGTPDGVTGPGTQHAINCGLEKYKLTPYDMSGLYRKLGLEF